MKTIEEKATHHAMVIKEDGSIAYNVGKYISFQRGAEWMREELTRWRDPNDPPSDNRDVLVKTTSCQKYEIAFFKAKGFRNYHWHTNNGSIDDDMVIGWRKIL